MAITRCPYCHAIIDENVKYCNNCGTQLLFAEDEETDDEIPGEKIIDAETEEKDYTVDEPEGEKRPTGVIDLDEDLEEEIEAEPEELALDKLVEEESGEGDVTEEVILIDETEAAEAGGQGRRDEAEDTAQTAAIKAAGEERDEEEKESEEIEPQEEKQDDKRTMKEPRPATEEAGPVIEYAADEKDRAEPAEEAASQPVTFDTRELEGMGKTIDLGKVKVDEFLEGLAEKRAEAEPPPMEVRQPTGTLPPWASVMKGAPVFSEENAGPETGVEDGGETPPPDGDEEVEIFPRRRDSDSTIGLPERVSQSPLPFERGEAEEEAEEEGEDAATAGKEPEEEKAPPAPSFLREREAAHAPREPERRPLGVEEMLLEPQLRPPFSFSVFFKSKAFDLLFVGLFWLVALWLAAHAMDMTLFEILGAMSGPMFLLYVVFVFMYFFLFKFFLGETLGDRLFRERE